MGNPLGAGVVVSPPKFLMPFQIEHLYGLTVFENYLYATNSDNANAQQKTSVIRVNRFNSTEYQVVTRVDKGGALHIYHQRRQPTGGSPARESSFLDREGWVLVGQAAPSELPLLTGPDTWHGFTCPAASVGSTQWVQGATA